MKPLLRPARAPSSGTLQQMIGLMACASLWCNREEFGASKDRLLSLLQRLVGSANLFLRSEEEARAEALYVAYELESPSDPSVCRGNVSFSFAGHQRRGGHMSAHLLWSAVPRGIEEVVGAADAIWREGMFDSFYVYDQDDFGLQNLTIAVGFEYSGLAEDQVEFIKKGPATEIETRYNPGYFENRDGLHVTVQWLNYWSAKVQKQLFGGRPRGLPDGVEIADMSDGAVRVRLAERPGKLDDVAFHELQLECRRRLGL